MTTEVRSELYYDALEEKQLRELSKKLWEAYRESPNLPNVTPEQKVSLKGIFGSLASVQHLKASISSHISDGYKEESPFIQTLKTRLKVAEDKLEEFEGVFYGSWKQHS